MKVIRANDDKNVKWKCGLKNKVFYYYYYLKMFSTVSHIIKLFYQTYLIYLIT